MGETIKSGDIRYVEADNRYQVMKVLRVDAATGIYHILSYTDMAQIPALHDLSQLEIKAWHTPADGLEDSNFLINRPVTEDELQGYYYYLKTTDFKRYCGETGQDIDAVIAHANEAFQEAIAFEDEERYTEAIAKYGEAIDAYPLFYEAIDNMGLVKMKMGKFQDAIDDFHWSLEVQPDSVLAEFSMGECYYKMGDLESAIEQFDRSLKIEPENDLALLYREKALLALEGGSLDDDDHSSAEPAVESSPESEVDEWPEDEPIVEEDNSETEEDVGGEESDPPSSRHRGTRKKKRWWPF